MFELSFHDERYLPFEFSGAESKWRIELPHENNHFDLEALGDLTLHLNFTAKDGGELLRQAANAFAQKHLPGEGVRFFDAKYDLSQSQLDMDCSGIGGNREIELLLNKGMFPYVLGNWNIAVHCIEILFRSSSVIPTDSHIVEFSSGGKSLKDMNSRCSSSDVQSIVCTRDATWPDLYHGVLELESGYLNSELRKIGVFHFPNEAEVIEDLYLFCRYHKE